MSDFPTTVIKLTDRRLSDKTGDASKALTKANTNQPRIFQQGGVLVRLRFIDGVPTVEPLTPDAMRGELDRVALWQAATKNGVPVVADPPMPVVKNLLTLPSYEGVADLRGVAEAPFFTKAGRLIATPGYHPDAATVLHFPGWLTIPPVPDRPSSDDVRRAVALITDDLLVDYPFTDAAGLAHTIGLLLLPFVRQMIDGPTPNHAIDSPMPATGKGLLADVFAMIATGRPVEVMTEAKDNEELRKRITAVLLSGTPLALFDNISRRLDSPVLAAALTGIVWRDRVLGVSKMVSVPIRITWLITGNNIKFTREIARRTTRIRLDAKTPEPHRRSRFKHDPLRAWVQAHRGQLIHAALVLVQHWIAQGQPRFKAARLGSYEDWSAVVGGILATAGIRGFLEDRERFDADADTETAGWKDFVKAWWEKFGADAVDVGALFPLAEIHLVEVLGDGSDRSQRTKLGLELSKKVDWMFDITTSAAAFDIQVATTNVVDQAGRTRNGWALRNAPEGVGKVGTLGDLDASEQDSNDSGSPNVPPNVAEPSPTLAETLGADSYGSSTTSDTPPNVPTIPTCSGAEPQVAVETPKVSRYVSSVMPPEVPTSGLQATVELAERCLEADADFVCTVCNRGLDEDDLVTVRECSDCHARTVDRACPDCGRRPPLRIVTYQGCRACLEEDSVVRRARP